MKRTFLIGISVVALAGAIASPAWAFTEIRKAAVRGDILDRHRIEATSCKKPRGFRRIRLKGGIKSAREGEVYAFEPRVIRAKRCEEVEIVLENTDSVRHAFMLPGLNPMFTLEFTGPQTRSLRFVTPDKDVTLDFHCHVALHEKMGMHGQLIVGRGGAPAVAKAVGEPQKRLYQGVGVVVATDDTESRSQGLTCEGVITSLEGAFLSGPQASATRQMEELK